MKVRRIDTAFREKMTCKEIYRRGYHQGAYAAIESVNKALVSSIDLERLEEWIKALHAWRRNVERLTAPPNSQFFMFGIKGRSSGLPMNIWIDPRRGGVACIKVQMNHHERFAIDQLAVVSLENDSPQIVKGDLNAADFDAVCRYIALNRAAILDHWHERIDGIEFSRALKRLS